MRHGRRPLSCVSGPHPRVSDSAGVAGMRAAMASPTSHAAFKAICLLQVAERRCCFGQRSPWRWLGLSSLVDGGVWGSGF